jgi:3',5'-cyclic AMP phosphodiesterase CpdA
MLSGRSADFTREIFAHLNQLDDLGFVLFSGDLFYTPTPQNLAVFQGIIRQLTKPYFIIPGNHDRRNTAEVEGLTLRQFAQLFNPQFKDRPATPETQAGYWSLPISPRIQLIGLDSVRNENWGGIIDATQWEWLKGELKTQADKFVILTVHHPLHKLAPVDDHPDYRYFVCDNGPEMIELLDEYPQVKLVLTGHHHQTKADLLGRRLHLDCPAVSVYPCAYRTLRLTELDSGAWQIEWQTHPATDEATIAESLERMVQIWQEVGFALDFVQTHVQLARGSEWDRHGVVEL